MNLRLQTCEFCPKQCPRKTRQCWETRGRLIHSQVRKKKRRDSRCQELKMKTERTITKKRGAMSFLTRVPSHTPKQENNLGNRNRVSHQSPEVICHQEAGLEPSQQGEIRVRVSYKAKHSTNTTAQARHPTEMQFPCNQLEGSGERLLVDFSQLSCFHGSLSQGAAAVPHQGRAWAAAGVGTSGGLQRKVVRG